MTVHLIKLSVGPETLSDLEGWQQQRLQDLKRARQPQELMHITRHMPKRSAEVLDGGSIYWVIKGWLCARQKLIDLRSIDIDGVSHCALVYDPEMIRVRPRKQRPFQGWRYFDPQSAPLDLAKGAQDEDMSDELWRELNTLGLV